MSLLDVIASDVHPPFYSVFMYGWIRLFGDSEIAIRIPPLVLSLASIVIVYALAYRFGETRSALLAAFLMSVSPVHIWYSQEARPYSTSAFLLLVAVLSFHKLQEKSSRRLWLSIYALSLTLAVFNHFYIAGFVVLLTVLWLWKNREAKIDVILVNGIVLLLFGAYLGGKAVVGRFATQLSYLREFSPEELWRLFFHWFLHGNALTNSVLIIGLQLLYLVFFIRGLMLFGSAHKRAFTPEFFTYLFGLPSLLLALWAFDFQNYYIERSLLILLPFFYILIARGAVEIQNRTAATLSLLLVIAGSVAVLFSYYGRNNEWTVYKPNPDWRSAAEHIVASSQPQVIFAVANATVLTYYSPLIVEDDKSGNPVQSKLEKIRQRFGEESLVTNILSILLRHRVKIS